MAATVLPMNGMVVGDNPSTMFKVPIFKNSDVVATRLFMGGGRSPELTYWQHVELDKDGNPVPDLASVTIMVTGSGAVVDDEWSFSDVVMTNVGRKFLWINKKVEL